MSTATKGRAFEHEIRDFKRAQGYTVERTAGSKGAADLIAHGRSSLNNKIVGIQAKWGPKPCGKELREAKAALMGWRNTWPTLADVIVEIWWRPRGGDTYHIWRHPSLTTSDEWIEVEENKI